jgi:transcriptional regulator with XRE-family HTH domain
MYLPGTPGEIIGDLRTARGLSKKQLSDITGIVPSQLSRIENGKIKNISSDILIKLARALNVSTDYILALTTIKEPRSHDISELRLSNGTVKAMLSGNIDIDILNCLLENEHFPYLLHLIKSYFADSVAAGIASRNEIIDIATSTLADFYKENPKSKNEVRQDIRTLKSQKLSTHEAEIEKIKNTFITILRDIKKDIDIGTEKTEPVTAEMFKQIKAELSNETQNNLTADDVATIVTNMFGQSVPMNEELEKSIKRTVSDVLSAFDNKK